MPNLKLVTYSLDVLQGRFAEAPDAHGQRLADAATNDPRDYTIEVLDFEGRIIRAATVTGWFVACDVLARTFQKSGGTSRETRIIDHTGAVVARRFVHGLRPPQAGL